jgi:hypothetical protein
MYAKFSGPEVRCSPHVNLPHTSGQWLLETVEWNEQTCRKMLWNSEWADLQLVGVTEDRFGA